MSDAAYPTVPPFERLALLIGVLCKAVADHGARGALTAPLQVLLWGWLSRMRTRALVLAKRMAAGEPLIATKPRPRRRSTPPRLYIRLPRGIAWLVRVVPGTAAGAATLRFLLDQPDMAAVADVPPMRRLLRPLCRMLGVDPPPVRRTAPPGAPAPAPAAREPHHTPHDPPLAEPPADPPAAPHPASSKNTC